MAFAPAHAPLPDTSPHTFAISDIGITIIPSNIEIQLFIASSVPFSYLLTKVSFQNGLTLEYPPPSSNARAPIIPITPHSRPFHISLFKPCEYNS